MGMRKYLAALGAVAATLAVALPIAFSGGASGASGPVDVVRAATSKYKSVDKAIDAGYVQFFGCVHEPLAGSMGIHFVNAPLVGDGEVKPQQPEAVIYEQQPNGTLSLVGVEYVVFQKDWSAHHKGVPTLFGQKLMLTPKPNRFGLDAFYSLHVWAWKTNPTGTFQTWNPKVICPNVEGHV